MRERFSFVDVSKRMILSPATAGRISAGGWNRCAALQRLGERNDIEMIYPVHLNPNVQEPVRRIIGQSPDIHLVDPLDYLPFVYLMSRADLIITDSGGIQEEAPSLGKPLLVTRGNTERPEVVDAGTVRLVGTDRDRIVRERRGCWMRMPSIG